jgi:hypothetical protein
MWHLAYKDDRPKGKCAKAMEIGGLKANWKQAVGLLPQKSATTSHCESSPELQDDPDLMDLEGEFAKDESAAMLTAVHASKTQRQSASHVTPMKAHVEGTAKVSV